MRKKKKKAEGADVQAVKRTSSEKTEAFRQRGT